jgi:segregation and condensation protein B
MIELKSILEAILFASQKPLAPSELKALLATAAEQSEDAAVRAFKKTKADDLAAALEQLAAEHEQAGRTYRLACVAGAWQFVTQPEFAPWLRALTGERARPGRLSQPALETITIIAYRQPLTRAEIEQVRGVSVDGVMQTLLERGLVEPTGRAEVVGRPMQYGTTKLFLEYFGLRELEDLPAADELRRIPVERPASLLTVEPGLATTPPEQLALPEVAVAPAETTVPAASPAPEAASDAPAAPAASAPEPAPPAEPAH